MWRARNGARFSRVPSWRRGRNSASLAGRADLPGGKRIWVPLAAGRGNVDEIIRPSETRARLIRSLAMLADKRDVNPRKKHGNIPL